MPIDPQTAFTALATLAGGSAAGAAVTGWLERRSRKAQIEKITAQAHHEIYKAYGELIDDLRTDSAAARAEAVAARKAAWAAETRATAAEARATAAETRAAAAEALVAEVHILVAQHPNAETLLAQIEALQRQRKARGA